MAKAKFIALVAFAHGNEIFDRHNKEGYEADEVLVNSWSEAGYVEVLEAPKKEIKHVEKEVKKTKKASGK